MQPGDSDSFYRALPSAPNLASVVANNLTAEVPDGWIVIATDVVDSTVAISEGRYKDVTVAGAVGTIAIANLTGSLEFPYFFGGDGMVFLLPGAYRERATEVLGDVRRVIGEISGLELRVGLVDVGTLRARGHALEVGKVQVTERYTQAVAFGSALAEVDRMLKDDGDTTMARPPVGRTGAATKADLSGFSCRWQDIPSHRGETLSLIVQPRGTDSSQQAAVLTTVDKLIIASVGDESQAHPLSVANQHTRGSGASAATEARVQTGGHGGLSYLWWRVRIAVEVAAVRLLMWSRLPLRRFGKTLRDARRDNILNADVRKYDGTLKLVVSADRQMRERLVEGLESLRLAGRLWYGIHIADRAVMTCLIHTNHEDEVHFVDAASGGYALAARMLKDQIAAT